MYYVHILLRGTKNIIGTPRNAGLRTPMCRTT